MKLTKKKIENLVNQLFREECCGYQFNIMDLGNVTKSATLELQNSGDIEKAREAIRNSREVFKFLEGA